jgi:PAS domain S-box-containing protein
MGDSDQMTMESREDTASCATPEIDPGTFRGVLEFATDAIGISTPEGRHFYQNRAFSELFGDVGTDPPSTLYCDQTVGNEVFAMIMGGGTWSGEVTMYAKDRRILTILLRAYAFTDENGRVVGLVGVHTDITDRRRAEEELRRSEVTYREIFNNVNDTIWIHDIDTFGFLDVNNRVTDMFGFSIEEALELKVEDVSSGVAPYGLESAVGHLKRARSGEPQLFEWHTRHKDGHLFWTEVGLKRATIAGRDCILAIERDITERKRTEETIRRVHALESLGTVAGGIAHDFNNLLMGIFGNIELAELSLSPDHRAGACLRAAHKALENARHLTNRLLTFAKGGNPVLEPIDLREHIAETVRFHLTGSKVAAHFDIRRDLWPARADKGHIVEVISNLTVNAKEAMPAGGKLFVSSENVLENALGCRCVKLTFRDQGTGIPDSILGRIFEPYFSTKQEGSGLGLSIVHGIVSRHNGTIEVASTAGEGTTICILLPADTTSPAPAVSDETPRPEALHRPRFHVLVVDDDKGIRETASRMLERLGCRVRTVVDGGQAIDEHKAAMKRGMPFDLTIMDLTIPGGMGGEEAVGELLDFDPSAKVIVSSGYSSDPVLAEYAEYGFAGRLAKPFTLKELSAVMTKALG